MKAVTIAAPPLAWLLRIRKGEPAPQLLCGSRVEVREEFFFEGAWAGPFEDGGLVDTDICMGSGARVVDGEVIVAAPTHALERIQYVRSETEVLVSNSLPFLLAATGDDVDVKYPFYFRDLMTRNVGLNQGAQTIPTLRGGAIHLYSHDNLVIDTDLNVSRQARPMPPRFGDYEAYTGYLRDGMHALADNANDENRGPRAHRYPLMTTISSGYDSAACSVLARDAGCTEAVTFREGRVSLDDRDTRDDSGAPIAEKLGLTLHSFDRRAYLDRDDYIEAEFFADGVAGNDMVMATMEEQLTGRMVVMGNYARSVWDRVTQHEIVEDLVIIAHSGASMAEFRLRAGFIAVNPPYFGCLRFPDIHAISNSPAMKPWSLGRDSYDRPIARRLLEDAGVPRDAFAQSKKGVTQPLITSPGGGAFYKRELERVLSRQSLADFRYFLTQRVFLRQDQLKGDDGYEVDARDFVFHWAMDKVIHRYRRALAMKG